jgi:hypothetical protein
MHEHREISEWWKRFGAAPPHVRRAMLAERNRGENHQFLELELEDNGLTPTERDDREAEREAEQREREATLRQFRRPFATKRPAPDEPEPSDPAPDEPEPSDPAPDEPEPSDPDEPP